MSSYDVLIADLERMLIIAKALKAASPISEPVSVVSVPIPVVETPKVVETFSPVGVVPLSSFGVFADAPLTHTTVPESDRYTFTGNVGMLPCVKTGQRMTDSDMLKLVSDHMTSRNSSKKQT